MAKISEAFVEISARTQKLQRGLRQSTQQTERFARKSSGQMKKFERSTAAASGAARLLSRALVSIGIAFSAQAVVGSMRQFVNEADRIAKLSDRLSITTSNIQKLAFAAERAGLNFQTIAIGIQRMTRRIGEANLGRGELVKVLDQLNLSARELVQLSPDQQFLRVADALNAIENPSERLATAFKFFDTEGVALLQLIKDGSGEVKKLFNRFEELGGGIDENVINKSADLKDSLTDLGAAFTGLKSVIVDTFNVSGVIDNVANSIAGLRMAIDALRKGEVDQPFNLRSIGDAVARRGADRRRDAFMAQTRESQNRERAEQQREENEANQRQMQEAQQERDAAMGGGGSILDMMDRIINSHMRQAGQVLIDSAMTAARLQEDSAHVLDFDARMAAHREEVRQRDRVTDDEIMEDEQEQRFGTTGSDVETVLGAFRVGQGPAESTARNTERIADKLDETNRLLGEGDGRPFDESGMLTPIATDEQIDDFFNDPRVTNQKAFDDFFRTSGGAETNDDEIFKRTGGAETNDDEIFRQPPFDIMRPGGVPEERQFDMFDMDFTEALKEINRTTTKPAEKTERNTTELVDLQRQANALLTEIASGEGSFLQ
jgi:hypothetical protein